MHDYFEILGVSPDARARDIRQAGRRRATAPHPDFCQDPDGSPRTAAEAAAPDPASSDLADAAIDFVDMAAVVARMQAAFFAAARSRSRGW